MSRVDWTEPALDELADIWVQATPDERDHLGPLVEKLNRDLEADPYEVGESRDGGLRVVVRRPLTVWFEVFDAGKLVKVVHAHRPDGR